MSRSIHLCCAQAKGLFHIQIRAAKLAVDDLTTWRKAKLSSVTVVCAFFRLPDVMGMTPELNGRGMT